jgi:hypothetical protein
MEEIDVPADDWKIGAPIEIPCVDLAARWYDHA